MSHGPNTLNPCCDQFAGATSAEFPREGKWREVRQCPVCKRRIRLHFEGGIGGDGPLHLPTLIHAAVGAEYVEAER